MTGKYKAIVAALVAVAAIVALVTLPVTAWLLAFVEWVRGLGALGAVVFGVAYVLATVFMLPGSVLTLGSGFLYGPLLGTLVVSPASVVGATLAFLVGRFVARGWVAKKLAGRPRFAALDKAIGEGGFKIVFLLRLSPILPFNLLNYSLGLTRVSLPAYIAGSLVGMLPGTFLYVYLGSLVTNASQLLQARGAGSGAAGATSAFYWVGLGATVLVTVLITRTARRALARELENSERHATRTATRT
ncbi:MAG: TVP38/TMEM64 family protein [Deltaproteobacteria bacterium]|nr:TVP38/TMEM64 family protein [Deltaproteobacteria bacterium]